MEKDTKDKQLTFDQIKNNFGQVLDKTKQLKQLTFDELPTAVSQILDELAEIKSSLKTGVPRPIISEDYIDIDQVAKELDYSVSYVKRLIKSGHLKTKMFGRRITIHRFELDRYIISVNARKDRMKKRDLSKARNARTGKRKQSENS